GYLTADGHDRGSITDNSVTGGNLRESNVWDRRNVALDHEWQIDDSSKLRTQLNMVNSKTPSLLPFGFSSAPTSHDTNQGFHVNYKKQSDFGLWNVSAYRNTYRTQGTLSYNNGLNVLKA